MASFERYTKNNVTDAQIIHTSDASDAAQADIVIGFSIANKHSSWTATVDAYITVGSATPDEDIYLVTGLKIPAGGASEIIQGKIVLDNEDVVKVKSDVAVDVWLSVLDSATA